MTTLAPVAIFIDHYASGPSGITTYADHLEAHLPDLHRINLHASTQADVKHRHLDVPAHRSHDPLHVADLLVDVTRRQPTRRVAWMPNVGDVSWAGAWHALRRLSPDERQRVRLFGIVHGDQDSQYEAMCRYLPIIAGMAGVSRQCVTTLAARLPARAPQVEHLQYPVALPATGSAPNWDAPLRVLYAGRFEESQKRVSRLPDLFERLSTHGVPFAATLAGDGPARHLLEARVSALAPDVMTRVRFAGSVPHARMPALLRAHDIVVLVSAFEGTPLVLLEAMASGVCPVVMDLPGGLPELLIDGENACLVPQGDTAAMAAALAALHRDRAGLARLKAAARDTLQRRANPAAHGAWLLARLEALWEGAAPVPERVVDPDPLGARIDRLVEAACARQPASIAIWGAGVVGRQIADRLLTAGITPQVMVDTDPVRHGIYRGVQVSPPAVLTATRPRVVCVGSIAFAHEIEKTLRADHESPEVLVP
jgi:glycosyltransferase involved in cell wall biosynthesis